MVFSSITFIFYFLPLFFLVYYLSDSRYKNAVILLGSIFFYAWGAPLFIFVILATTFLDYQLVGLMHRSHHRSSRTILFIASLALNLGLLFYFKYSNFFIHNLNKVFSGIGIESVTWAEVVLPIGISFYTFESITYVTDVYRRIHKPLTSFAHYQLYIILFPKLIAGPIIRYHDFAPQLTDHITHETVDNKLLGLQRFFWGLGKKVLIANVLGNAADQIFDLPLVELSTTYAWLGAVSYTFQIYFDFSGYSDMAIGLGLMMGFRFPENFNNPYTALSIADFWRRWHITLGAWMRQYLYIPLGGNRVDNAWRLYFNLWLVFLASGLWHGAAWGFIIWGAYHGFFLVVERLFLGRWLQRAGKAAVLYTFTVVVVGWVFFRLEYLHLSLQYLHHMFSWQPFSTLRWQPDPQFWTILILATLFSFIVLFRPGHRLHNIVYTTSRSVAMHVCMTMVAMLLCILSVASITNSSFNPFIYFRF